jgi:hypothetical protein
LLPLLGFSRHVSLGQIGQIRRSSRAAMHVRLYGAAPPGGLQWRGVSDGRFRRA